MKSDYFYLDPNPTGSPVVVFLHGLGADSEMWWFQLQELVEAGMQLETTVGIQGPGWMVPDFETHLKDDERLNTIAQLARMLEGEPVLSPHFLAVARRPGVEA